MPAVVAEHLPKFAVRSFRKFPANQYRDTFRDVRRFADQLLESGNFQAALKMYELNRETYPSRSRAYISLGEWHQKAGDAAAALQHFRKGLALLPQDSSLYTALKFALERYVREQLASLTAE